MLPFVAVAKKRFGAKNKGSDWISIDLNLFIKIVKAM
jgi:hypothetical protein